MFKGDRKEHRNWSYVQISNYQGPQEERTWKIGQGLVEHYRKNLQQEAHGHLDPENVGYLCGGVIGEIKWLIAEWEETIEKEESVEEDDIEDCMILSLNPGYTRDEDVQKDNPFIYISSSNDTLAMPWRKYVWLLSMKSWIINKNFKKKKWRRMMLLSVV